MSDQRRLPPHLQRRVAQNQAQQPIQPSQLPPTTTQPTQPPTQQHSTTQPMHHHPTNYSQPTTQPNYSQSTTQPTSQPAPRKQNKLDSEQIPRPIISSEQSVKVVEIKNSQCLPPPYAYVQVQQDNHMSAGPRFIRTTMNSVATELKQAKALNLPLGVVVQPFADAGENEPAVQLVSNQDDEPLLRCGRCKAYVNPFWEFNHDATAICNLCRFSNTLSARYQDGLSQITNGVQDRFNELRSGVYDLQTPSQYVNKSLANYKHCVVFCLEMSPLTVGMGIFQVALQTLEKMVEYDMMAGGQSTEVAILTFDQGVQLYALPQDLTKEINIMRLGDIEEACCALSHAQMFISLKNGKERLSYLIEKLLKMSESVNQQYIEIVQSGQTSRLMQPNAMGAALLNSVHAVSPHNGRVLLFSSQTPSNGYGKYKPRESFKLMGTDKEKTLYQSNHQAIIDLARHCVQNKVGVDWFYFPSSVYQDIQQVMMVVNRSGGQFYYYQKYSTTHSQKLENELQRNLVRSTYYDVIMTIRASPGIQLQQYYDSDGEQVCRDLETACWNSDKAINILLKQEESIQEQKAYIQYALLCTSAEGVRMVRVVNQQLNVVNDILQLYRSVDVDALTRTLMLPHINNLATKSVKDIRAEMMSQLAGIFYNYRAQCVPNTNPAQLIFPDSLKLLPLYLQSLTKQQLLHVASPQLQVSPDCRTADKHLFSSCDLYTQALRLSPKIYPLAGCFLPSSDDEPQHGDYVDDYVLLPQNLPLLVDRVQQDQLYLIDNADTLYILVNPALPDHLVQLAFGVQNLGELQTVLEDGLPDLEESEPNQRMNRIVNQLCRNKSSSYQNTYLLLNNDANYQFHMNLLFLEEQTKGGESYENFLCLLHKAIQEKYV